MMPFNFFNFLEVRSYCQYAFRLTIRQLMPQLICLVDID